MPRYKVKEAGFMHGVLHIPGHPRKGVIHTEKPLKPIPKWLESMRAETSAQRKKREAETAEAGSALAAQASADRIDRDAVTFTESPKSSIVETL